MNPTAALKLLSKDCDCSVEQARQFCSTVRSYCLEEEPTDREILSVVRELAPRDTLPSYHDVAQKLEDDDVKGGPIQKNDRDVAIERFEGPSDHQNFIDWTDHNEDNGFVLNLRGEDRDPILHVASCSALRTDPAKEEITTSSVKLCSTNQNALRSKGQNLAEGKLQWCQTCRI